MDSLDSKIYELLAKSADAKLPFVYCGDDPANKWELISLLKANLKKSAASDCG